MQAKCYFSVIFLMLLFAFFSESLWAAMRCGTHLITDGKSPGPSEIEVMRKCGEPYSRSYSRSGNSWIYVKGGSTYRLRFSENSGLVSIKREIER